MKLNKIKIGFVGKNILQTHLAKKLDKNFSTVNAYCCNRKRSFLNISNEIAKILSMKIAITV